MEDEPLQPDVEPEPPWRKNDAMVRRGFRDLEYLPAGRTAWNMTLAAYAFSMRRRMAGRANLNLWAAMHDLPPSARSEALGADGLVLWHGTSAQRAREIGEHGLFHKRGVWAAAEPRIAHGYTRGRSGAFAGGSAMVVLLISKSQWEGRAEAETPDIARFHQGVPPECVEYILYADRAEFRGAAPAGQPRPWGKARFNRAGGRWLPQSSPPVRLDRECSYGTLEQWLEASIRRILRALGPAAPIEVFSSLYATLEPWDALEHEHVLGALAKLCGPARPGPGGLRTFGLPEADHGPRPAEREAGA